ncbi:hypothetical protein ATZ36_14915 [Candidatus Endomicrobiellum trichonymphae]|jgi:hypothetical protein|uniref:Uncharacterized protein n=1 Tax=Endomicrobium trichonymphae TaxID=1408204 RepID=A0A1E5ILT0_ENDTX|nr:hypothetical protein ATZ36_14915 [Candidatus Endomicrobium trichonymphae]
MFCNIKLLFFIIVYLMNMLLYYFIGKQLVLAGIMSRFILGSFVIFGIIVVSCFIVSLILSFLFKYSYMACCWIFKIEKAGFSAFSRNFWIIFTGLIYFIMLIIFLKVTEY